MKRFILFSLLILLLIPSIASAKSSYVDKFIYAMKHGGEGLNSIITPDFEYTNLSFEFKNRLFKGTKGDLPFFAKTSRPIEIIVDEIRQVPGGSIAYLDVIAETGLYRGWQIILFIRSNGITKITEIATEGVFEGHPKGCPETAFKRDSLVTLQGNPEGLSGHKTIKLYKFNRDTDEWSYANPGVDPKMEQHCTPRPNTFQVESEVIVFNDFGQIEFAKTVAAEHKSEKQELARGASFFEEDGVNFPGRLFNLGSGKEGLLLTFSISKGGDTNATKSNIARLYVWKGSSLKSIWGFGVGESKSSGFLGDFTTQFEWGLRSSPLHSAPTITATLQSNIDSRFKCKAGTRVPFIKKGSSFKSQKGTYPSSCLKHKGLGGNLIVKKEDKGLTFYGEAKEIDWRFMK